MELIILDYLEQQCQDISFKKFLESTGKFVHKVTLPDHNGVTQLHHLAFLYANSKCPELSIKIINVMHFFIKSGACMDLTDTHGNTPCHMATPGERLYWEKGGYEIVEFNGQSNDNFSHLKSISIFNRIFTRPTTMYSKNSYNLTPITLFQIKNMTADINTLVHIFPVTIRCQDTIEMQLLNQLGTEKRNLNQLLVSSIKHGCPLSPVALTVQQTSHSNPDKRSLLAITLLNSIFGISTLKEYMWLLMPQLSHFCHKIDSILPHELLDFGVDSVIACFECLLFTNTYRPLSLSYVNFIPVYFKFLLQFQFCDQVKLCHIKQFVLDSRDNLAGHYSLARTPPQYPSLFIVLFVTYWMDTRPDDATEGREILRGFDSKVDLSKIHTDNIAYQREMPDSLIKVSDIFKTKHATQSIHSTLTRKQLLKKNKTF